MHWELHLCVWVWALCGFAGVYLNIVFYIAGWVCPACDRAQNDKSHSASDKCLFTRLPYVHSTIFDPTFWWIWTGAFVVWYARNWCEWLVKKYRIHQWLWERGPSYSGKITYIYVWFFKNNVHYLIQKMWFCCCHYLYGSLFWLKFVEVFLYCISTFSNLNLYEFGTKKNHHLSSKLRYIPFIGSSAYFHILQVFKVKYKLTSLSFSGSGTWWKS